MSWFRSGRVVPSERRPAVPRADTPPPAPQSALLEAGQQLAATGYHRQAELSRCIEWFRHTFAQVARIHGRVTLRDFRQVAREYEEFALNLFMLFDSDHNGSVSLQELVGGLSKLTKHPRPKKILHYFEVTFATVSGEDHLLQLDEFQEALKKNLFVENLFRLIDPSNHGRVSLSELMDSLEKLTVLDRDAKWLAWFEQQFAVVAGDDRQIDKQEFREALRVKQCFFANRFFELFDQDGNGTISLKELMDGLSILTNGSEVDKLKFLFQVYDVDGNGVIDYEELRVVLKSCMNESALSFSEAKLDELTRALFEDADTDNSGSISFEELQAELDKHPGVVENLTISAANWLQPPKPSQRRTLASLIPQWASWRYLRNNIRYTIYVGLFIVINIGLFLVGSIIHREKGPAVAIARGCGQCLNFNPVLVMILMMRRGLTWLRSTRIAVLLPLDQHIELHKLTGYTITFFGLLHTVAHLINFTLKELEQPPGALLSGNTTGSNLTSSSSYWTLVVSCVQISATNRTEGGLPYPVWQYLLFVGTDVGWVCGTAGLTGVLLLATLLVLVICSLPCIRRRGLFEVFYWTHNLFVVWYVLLILHGPDFWKWFVVPGLLYIAERLLRSKLVKFVQHGRMFIKEGLLLPSRVTHLVVTRPESFHFQPGDYVYIQIPQIAKYEWHPFTISSAPEKHGYFWLHIRSVGTWTNKLYTFFEERNQRRQRSVVQMQLPRDHGHFQRNLELEQAAQALDDDDGDIMQLGGMELHPLAPQHGCQDYGRSPTSPHLVHHTQDFSHIYDQPAVIDVTCEEEDPGIKVYIDGPYGTPSAHIFHAEHAVLIGAGIGVTPFASILQSIMYRYRAAQQVCPKCNHSWATDISSSSMKLRKVDFFWINRDQRSFEWFITLLSQLEMEQTAHGELDRFLEMHMYMTSALSKTDMKAIGLQMALDLIHKKEKRDLITGLKTRTQAGRPDWDRVFERLSQEGRGKVTVFFCGSPALSDVLKTHSTKYNFAFRKENF